MILPTWIVLFLAAFGLLSIGKDIALYLVYGKVLPIPRDEQTEADKLFLHTNLSNQLEETKKELATIQVHHEELTSLILRKSLEK